jgi:hypothetical protein
MDGDGGVMDWEAVFLRVGLCGWALASIAMAVFWPELSEKGE